MSEIRWQDFEVGDELPCASWDEFRRDRDVTGDPPDAPIALFVAREALEAARAHGRSSPEAEVGGILYGRAHRLAGANGDRTIVDVVAAIAAHRADGTPAHLVFTQEAWEHVFAERARLGADLEIVGWYHTHPGLGVFLSGTDLRTQAAFFGRPWQVAMVLDPDSGLEGTFLGPGGEPTRFVDYGPARAQRPPAPRARSTAAAMVIGASAAFVAGLVWVFARRRNR